MVNEKDDGAGKGDAVRPRDNDKWDAGYERIFGKPKTSGIPILVDPLVLITSAEEELSGMEIDHWLAVQDGFRTGPPPPGTNIVS